MKTILTSVICLLLILLFPTASFAQWVKTAGPEGMSVCKFFAYHGALYAGTHAQGVYISHDNGTTWGPSNNGIQNKWVLSFTADSSYLYAGVLNEGVYRSSDNGQTWQPAGNLNEAAECMLVADNHLFVGTVMNGVYRSDDHGNTWTDANGGLLTGSAIWSMVYQAPRLIVEGDNYLFYSADLGGTWDIDNGTTAFYAIDNFLHKGDTLFASVSGAIFKSTDGGVNWSAPTILSTTAEGHISGIDRVGDTVYAGFARGVYRSTDWGQ